MDRIAATLLEALRVLQLSPPDNLIREALPSIWSWAIENWQLGKLFGQIAIVKTA
jgi:hypothetical protein